ncbi:MAG: hypothetical protein RLN89_06025 [Parvibaculum sp.]
MKRVWLASLVLAVILSLVHGPSAASVSELAVQDYDQGRFLTAAAAAREAGTAEGFAFAARAELAHADMLAPMSGRGQFIARAEEDARAAIALEPEAAEPHLQLAIALGFKGRLDGEMLAHLEGYADEARAHLDFVLAREPDNPWAHALLGGWHLEIVGLGGFVGRTLYGATIDAGLGAYERALELRPGDPVISYQCALQLASLDKDEYRARAIEILERATGSTASSFLDEKTRERMAELETALGSGDRKQIAALVKRHRWGFDPKGSQPQPRIDLRPSTGLPR